MISNDKKQEVLSRISDIEKYVLKHNNSSFDLSE